MNSPSLQNSFKNNKNIFTGSTGAKIAYERFANYLVIAGEPFEYSEKVDGEIALKEFVEFAGRSNKKICGYYFSSTYFVEGLRYYKLGEIGKVNICQFNLRGSSFREARRSQRKLVDYKCEVIELDLQKRILYKKQIEELYEKWISSRTGPRIGFLLSPPNWINHSQERWFCTKKDMELLSFITLRPYSPRKGSLGYYLDLMVHDPSEMRFSLEGLMTHVFSILHQEGVCEIDLGLCPFKIDDPKNLVERSLSVLGRFRALYNADGIRNFKNKFSPKWQSAYLVLDDSKFWANQSIPLFLTTFPGIGQSVKKSFSIKVLESVI